MAGHCDQPDGFQAGVILSKAFFVVIHAQNDVTSSKHTGNDLTAGKLRWSNNCKHGETMEEHRKTIVKNLDEAERKLRFRANLHRLMSTGGWSLEKLSRFAKLDRDGRKWLGRIHKDGLARMSTLTSEKLEKVAQLLGATYAAELWNDPSDDPLLKLGRRLDELRETLAISFDERLPENARRELKAAIGRKLGELHDQALKIYQLAKEELRIQ